MSNTVGHNTEMMREWSESVSNYASEYDSLIHSLYNLLQGFVSSDFTGGLSKDFESKIMEQKPNFERLTNFLEDASNLVKRTSADIDSDEEELRQMINNSDIIG